MKSFGDNKVKNVLPLKDETLNAFLSKLNSHNLGAAILKVMQPFAADRVTPVVDNLLKLVSLLYNEDYEAYYLEMLRKVPVDLSITQEQQRAVIEKTLAQSKILYLFSIKAGRITASKFNAACHTFPLCLLLREYVILGQFCSRINQFSTV
ncbi:uncharacterized protein LOC117172984 [Belonocnema kinseyi]|uniref:uncharacterized protein LOC117172984 n=1 Tax=Belonocnema kinseyi TaxID=2817044 RepID=UPI00143D7C96|nr:uncharacterized protein LOC117172984 [Belonocnema kinseyi]